MAESQVYRLDNRPDYDRSVRVGGRKMACYSRAMMEALYPEGGYELVGETAGRKGRSGQNRILGAEGDVFLLVPPGTCRPSLYRSLGYVAIAGREDAYLKLLAFRKAPVGLCFFVFLVLVGWGMLSFLGGYGHGKMTLTLRPDGHDPVSLEEDSKWKGPDGEEGGRVSLAYRDGVRLDRVSGQFSLYLANPDESSHDLTLRLVVESGGRELVLAESGRIRPGGSLLSLALKEGIQMAEGTYGASFHLDYFDAITGQKARVRTRIPVRIDVE